MFAVAVRVVALSLIFAVTSQAGEVNEGPTAFIPKTTMVPQTVMVPKTTMVPQQVMVPQVTYQPVPMKQVLVPTVLRKPLFPCLFHNRNRLAYVPYWTY